VFWLKKRDVFSNFDRDPYELTAAPSAAVRGGEPGLRAAGNEGGAPRSAKGEKRPARTSGTVEPWRLFYPPPL
jgi:hypothetical protein